MYTSLYIKQINRDLLYSIGHYSILCNKPTWEMNLRKSRY